MKFSIIIILMIFLNIGFVSAFEEPDAGAFGVIKLVEDYDGPAMKVRRASDNAEMDISFSGDRLDMDQLNEFLGGSEGFVRILYDQTNNSANLGRDESSQQPRIDIINGSPTFIFSGGQILSSAKLYQKAFKNKSSFTFFIPIKWDGTAASQGYMSIFSTARFINSDGYYPFSLHLANTNALLLNYKFTDGARHSIGGGRIDPGKWHIIRVVFNKDYSMEFWVDGKLKSSSAAAGLNSADSNSYAAWGSNWDPRYYFTGEMHPPLIYTRPVYTSEATDIEEKLLSMISFQEDESPTQTVIDHEKLNPTGEPIAGGVGYSHLISRNEASVVVYTPEELVQAIESASAGNVIYLDDESVFDMTEVIPSRPGRYHIVVPAGVTIASGRGSGDSRGALIRHQGLFNPQHHTAIFETSGPNVRFTGLRLLGPHPFANSRESGNINDDIVNKISPIAIKTRHNNVEIDNNELWGWSRAAIDVTGGDKTTVNVHHNYIHHNSGHWWGYGVLTGGNANTNNHTTIIEANIFDGPHKHHTASSAHPNTWIVRHNLLLGEKRGHSLDRHGSYPYSGNADIAHHNYFEMTSPANDALTHKGGPPRINVTFHNNWLSHDKINNALGLIWYEKDNLNWWTQPRDQNNCWDKVCWWDNSLGGVHPDSFPILKPTISPSEGTSPLTVSFNDDGSYDPQGHTLTSWDWRAGDWLDVDARYYMRSAQHTFTVPGLHSVELWVKNEFGVPARKSYPILVHPQSADGKYLLSFWWFDNYHGLSNQYIKQVLIDDQVVYEENLAGLKFWEHHLLDVTPFVEGKDWAEIEFRLTVNPSLSQTVAKEAYLMVDDVHLFGGNVIDGTFEDWNGAWRGVGQSYSARTGQFGGWKAFGYDEAPALNAARSFHQLVEIYPDGYSRFDGKPTDNTSSIDEEKFSSPIAGFAIAGDAVSVSDTIVYDIGYYSTDGITWIPYSLSGNAKIGSWLVGSASANVELSSAKYVVAYSCSWTEGWDCHGDKWQLYALN